MINDYEHLFIYKDKIRDEIIAAEEYRRSKTVRAAGCRPPRRRTLSMVRNVVDKLFSLQENKKMELQTCCRCGFAGPAPF